MWATETRKQRVVIFYKQGKGEREYEGEKGNLFILNTPSWLWSSSIYCTGFGFEFLTSIRSSELVMSYLMKTLSTKGREKDYIDITLQDIANTIED
jgi:hypothetical protein